MSLSNIGLKRQIKDFFGICQKDYTADDLKKKQARCDELFDELHNCVQKHGWNDNHCQAVVKPKYDQCIIKRDKIKTQLLEKEDAQIL